MPHAKLSYQLRQLSNYCFPAPNSPLIVYLVKVNLCPLFSFASRHHVEVYQERTLKRWCRRKGFFFLVPCAHLAGPCRAWASPVPGSCSVWWLTAPSDQQFSPVAPCPRQFCNRVLWWEPSHKQIHQLPRGWFSGKFQKAELQRAPSAGHQSDFYTTKGTIAMSSLTRPGGLFLGSMSAQKTVAAPHMCCFLYFLEFFLFLTNHSLFLQYPVIIYNYFCFYKL